MPRNISFMLTTQQIRERTKTVTRRNGWTFLKAGDVLCAVEKSQGLGKGGKIKRLCLIRVKNVKCEPLRSMIDDLDYGFEECEREGFPDVGPNEFVAMFCRSHKKTTADSIITRIEFEYVDEEARA
jgi:hypothetical protein